MFGKPFSEYVRFAGVSLAIIAGVALLVCGLVYSALVHTKGFGSYKHILPVVWLQAMTMNVVIIAGIALAIFTGQDNIFTTPEFANGQDGKNWFPHVFGHVIAGAVIEPLVLWGLGSLVMLVTKKVSKGPDAQRAAA